MNLRFIERDGKKILQEFCERHVMNERTGASGRTMLWVDVPLHKEPDLNEPVLKRSEEYYRSISTRKEHPESDSGSRCKVKKPMEFWLTMDGQWFRKKQDIAVGEIETHVREVIPGSVMVTREQVTVAWNEKRGTHGPHDLERFLEALGLADE